MQLLNPKFSFYDLWVCSSLHHYWWLKLSIPHRATLHLAARFSSAPSSCSFLTWISTVWDVSWARRHSTTICFLAATDAKRITQSKHTLKHTTPEPLSSLMFLLLSPSHPIRDQLALPQQPSWLISTMPFNFTAGFTCVRIRSFSSLRMHSALTMDHDLIIRSVLIIFFLPLVCPCCFSRFRIVRFTVLVLPAAQLWLGFCCVSSSWLPKAWQWSWPRVSSTLAANFEAEENDSH